MNLSYGNGTILHGVMFRSNNINNFACTDVIIYKNINVYKYNFLKKFDIMHELFSLSY